MKKFSLFFVLILVIGQDVSARPSYRESKQLVTTLSTMISSLLGVGNGIVQSVLSAQRDMVDNFLRRTDNEIVAASGFVSDVLTGAQEAADAIEYIRDDFLLDGDSNRIGRKNKNEPVFKPATFPISINKFFLNGMKTASGIADGKLKMLMQMSSNTGKLVADTTKQISKVLKATAKFTKKVEKQKDKFDDKVTKEKLKLIETTQKSLSKFLKELSKISSHAAHHHDSPKARSMLEAENELIDITRESFNDILEETARAIERVDNLKKPKVKKPKHPTKKPSTSVSHHPPPNTKATLISRMLSSASEKIKIFAKLTKQISKAIQKASKQKQKDIKKAQKEIKKKIKKAQKAKKKIKKNTKKDIKKILKDETVSDENSPLADGNNVTPESFNATLGNATLAGGDLLSNENGTVLGVSTAKPITSSPSSEEVKEEEEEEEDEEDEGTEDEDEDNEDDGSDEEEEDDENENDEQDDQEEDDEEPDEEESEDDEIQGRNEQKLKEE